jgi:hypothetical protein
MSYATLALTVVIVINLGLFLLAPPGANSPAIGLIKLMITGNLSSMDWGYIFSLRNVAIIGTLCVVTWAIASGMSPGSVLSGGFQTFHVLTILGIGIFVALFALPNIGFMGIPEPIASIIQVFFGSLMLFGVMGFLKGGE